MEKITKSTTTFKVIEYDTHYTKYKVGNHSHNYFEIVYYISGEGEITINDNLYHFKANTFSIANPNSTHSEKSITDVSLIYIGFTVEDGMDISFLRDGLYECPKDIHILPILKEINNEYQNKSFYYLEQINLLLNYLLNLLKRVRSSKKSKSIVMQDIKAYIEKHANENLNAKVLAEKFNYNYDHFRREFIKFFDMSVNDFILKIQVDYATNLLRTTDYKIEKIADLSGFSSTSHFINCFKKIHNVTPKKYLHTYEENL